MIEVNVCPSTLQQGFDTYSPAARKQLFDGKKVSFILDFDSPNNDSADNESYLKNVGRISLSGVQPKASLVLDSEGHLVKPSVKQSTTISVRQRIRQHARQALKGVSAQIGKGIDSSFSNRHCQWRRLQTTAYKTLVILKSSNSIPVIPVKDADGYAEHTDFSYIYHSDSSLFVLLSRPTARWRWCLAVLA